MTGTFEQYWNLTPYVILTLLDVFQMCYFGEILKRQSSHSAEAFSQCPWYLCGGPFRRIASVLLTNSNEPMVLTGSGFFILDFSKLINVSSKIRFFPIISTNLFLMILNYRF